MQYRIVWDVDGVLRDLYTAVTTAFNFKITTWNWKHKGKDIYDLARKKPEIIYDAPVTKYLKTINSLVNGHIELWSHQPPEWRIYTDIWLRKNLKSGIDIDIRYLTPKEKYRALLKEKDAILVEDYPLYPNYDRIILVDTPYNQNAKAIIRVKTEKELKSALSLYR
jgi:hypothetical protein